MGFLLFSDFYFKNPFMLFLSSLFWNSYIHPSWLMDFVYTVPSPLIPH